MEELSIPAGHHTRHNSFVHDKKRLRNLIFRPTRSKRNVANDTPSYRYKGKRLFMKLRESVLKQQGFKRPPVSFNA
jgi:hypothetical protein